MIAVLLSLMTLAAPEAPVDFARDIRPILSENCFACHGPDAADRQAGLRLDDGKGAFEVLRSGARAVAPGDRHASELYQRITAEPEDRMPPASFPKTLSEAQVDLLGRWIDEGAPWAQHWAFIPPAQHPLPEVQQTDWPRNAIDHFILARLEREGLAPAPEADRRTLIRRVSFDLHGLPPTPEEVEAFLADERPDAYERLVDRLLASPRYGERWARHWLDVVKYGDTHGYDKDKRREHAWPYRDYVIESLNADKPYGRFIREQIAGDMLFPDAPEGVVALGFIAAGPWDFVGHAELREGTVDKQITRVLDRDDMVANAMNTFVSMTAQCARCHDHKFDPISKREYYALQSVFAGVDRANRNYDPDPSVHAQRLVLRAAESGLGERMAAVEEQVAGYSSASLSDLDAQLTAVNAELQALRRGLNQSPSNGYHSAIATMRDTEKWVQVDLGVETPVDAVHLIPAFPTDFRHTPGFGFPIRFRVEASGDAAFSNPILLEDQSAENFPNPGEARHTVPGTPEPVRFLRVTALRLWEREDDFVFALGELEVERAGENMALGKPVEALDSIESGRWSTAHLVNGYDSRRQLGPPDAATAQSLEKLEAELARLREARAAEKTALLPDELQAEREDLETRLSEITRALEELPEPHKVYAATHEFASIGTFAPPEAPREVFVLARGEVTQPLEPARPGALALVPGIDADFKDADDEGARRAALAEWLAHPDNILTWRSIVNRVWHYHFGRGIVETPNDFGNAGAPPSHPELLDWLALSIQEHGESLHWLHRLIVTSATYRQAVVENPDAEALDAGNALLWRMNRRQLDAEALRDAMLHVSGKLDPRMGGPGFDLFVFEDDHSPRYLYERHDPEDAASWRRSVYRFVVRSMPDPFMETLDCADPSQSVPVRNTTVTALQALATMNNPFVVRQAEYFAERLEAAAPGLEAQLGEAYRLAFQRAPGDAELAALKTYAANHGLANACRLIFNSNEFMFVD